MRDAVLVVLRVGLPIKELGPLLVEVDQVLRELTPLGLVLDSHWRERMHSPVDDTYRLQQGHVRPSPQDVCELPGCADVG